MDVMDLRRRLLMQMLGGGSEMLGRFSKYKSISVTPTDANQLQFANPLDVLPKIMIITCPSDSAPYTAMGKCLGGTYSFEMGGGATFYYRASDSLFISTGATMFLNTDSTASNLPFGTRTNGDIFVRRVTATVTWATDTTYTVELLA